MLALLTTHLSFAGVLQPGPGAAVSSASAANATVAFILVVLAIGFAVLHRLGRGSRID
ncbi:MAG: hypothetical protein JNL82_15575 [Myxococcales bacterium]|nr:hypothetical protein [Myxococcales bacterium]